MDKAGNIEKALLAQLGDPDSRLIRRVTRNNQILLHNYRTEVEKICHCPLPGCGQAFWIILVPNQILYPRFCGEHRTEFRRDFHLQQLAAAEPYPSTPLRVRDSEFSIAT
jgi:hypothetical protein